MKVVANMNCPFFLTGALMMFSIAMSMGTSATNNSSVVYGVGGQAIQSNSPENIASKRFFFMRYKETMDWGQKYDKILPGVT